MSGFPCTPPPDADIIPERALVMRRAATQGRNSWVWELSRLWLFIAREEGRKDGEVIWNWAISSMMNCRRSRKKEEDARWSFNTERVLFFRVPFLRLHRRRRRRLYWAPTAHATVLVAYGFLARAPSILNYLWEERAWIRNSSSNFTRFESLPLL